MTVSACLDIVTYSYIYMFWGADTSMNSSVYVCDGHHMKNGLPIANYYIMSVYER